ncbi:AAA family ATPase [Streptomyces sp. TLI_146]|uniref:ATP-binding protein n=1 Tax=Streptomyces sp. TLI_146 TaxID=1938858 RepID=UPI000C6FEB76|nr:LuxR family transcriptional regulator [Streptomyces sp. TLI_146]PKV90064.1 regulatory LuxR family protein [Streptomyces sp. TLI_146]
MPAPRPTSPALIGREAQLEALTQAAAQPPCVLVITGESGIGKTRMVHEILRTPALEGLPHLTGHCTETAEASALAPVIDALSCLPATALREVPPRIAGVLAPLLPTLAGLLPAPLPVLQDARAERHRRLRAAHALLASTGPAVLILEDIHWADASTREFLRMLTTALPAHLTVILTDRDDTPAAAAYPSAGSWLSGTHAHEIRLTPLTAAETGELAAQLMGTDHTSEQFTEHLHQRTAGIPFAIEEVIRLIGDGGGALPTDGTAIDQVGLPAPVRRVFLERLSLLSEQARDIIAAAAVAARPVTVDLLADIADLPRADTRRAVIMALDHGVLFPGPAGTLAFRHSLARQAAYETFCEFERRPLHLRAAKAVLAHISPPPLTEIAHHYQQAGRTKEYLRYTEAAGDRATAHGDPSTATCHYLTALNDHPGANARIRLGIKLGIAAQSAMPHDGVIPALQRILAEDSPPQSAAGELRLYLGTLMRNQAGLGLAGLNEISRAATELADTAPELAARAMSAIAIPSLKGWPLKQHLAWLDRAEALIPRIADPVQRTAIAANKASVLMFAGEPDAWSAAADLPQTPSSPAEEVQLARARVNLAHATTALGHPVAAQEYLAQANAILENNGIPYLEALAETAHLLLAWTTGHWRDLGERAHRATVLFGDIRDLAAESHLVRGLVALHSQGDTAAARADLVHAARTTQLDTGIVLPASAAALARIHLAAGRSAHAQTETLSALDHIRRTGGWIWATDLAPAAVEALNRTGRHEQADQLVEEFAHGIDGHHAPAASASLLACRAHLAEAHQRHDEAATLFARAALAWTQVGRPLETGHALQGAALCALVCDRRRAEEYIPRALDTYRSIGAKWDLGNCHRLLRRHGITRDGKRGPIGHGDTLTPREHQVALLAAQGLTNRAIAEDLHVSSRTVEQHVAKAIRKLGVSNRTQLAAALTVAAADGMA